MQTKNNNVKLEALFDAHLNAQQYSEATLQAPKDSYLALNQARLDQIQAFYKIPTFNIDNVCFILAVPTIIAHYYFFNQLVFHNDWVALGLIGTMGLIPCGCFYLAAIAGIGVLTNEIRLALWKRKKINKPIVDAYKALSSKVKELSEAHDTVCELHFSEKNYFRCMFNFDQMAERITHHPVYTPAFYQHELYTSKINLPEIRNNIKQAYLDGKSTEFFSLYCEALKLEKTVAEAWVKFEAQDAEILEEKYQAFSRTQTGSLELQDII